MVTKTSDVKTRLEKHLGKENLSNRVKSTIAQLSGLVDEEAAYLIIENELKVESGNMVPSTAVLNQADTRKVVNGKLQSSGIDWEDVKLKSNFISFSADMPTVQLQILSFDGTTDTIFADGTTATQYNFSVLDKYDNTQKLWNITSKRLLNQLKLFEPLIGRTLFVRKTGSGFQTFYVITEHELPIQ